MEVILNQGRLKNVLSEIRIKPPNRFNSKKGYQDSLIYSCGCNEKEHRVNDQNIIMIGNAMPVKFLLLCPNQYVSFIRIKGFFRQEVTNYWTCRMELYEKLLSV